MNAKVAIFILSSFTLVQIGHCQQNDKRILLFGDCPITSNEDNGRVKGKAKFFVRLPFDMIGNVGYNFATQQAMEDFEEKLAETPFAFQEICPAMDGYCPVAYHKNKELVFGNPKFSFPLDGRSYWFSSEEYKEIFVQAAKDRDYHFVPVLGGECINCKLNNRRVPGLMDYGHVCFGRLYLFPNESARTYFSERISDFANKDIAHNGNCPVANHEGRVVKGNGETALLHHRLIYHFENEASRELFLANPQTYVE